MVSPDAVLREGMSPVGMPSSLCIGNPSCPPSLLRWITSPLVASRRPHEIHYSPRHPPGRRRFPCRFPRLCRWGGRTGQHQGRHRRQSRLLRHGVDGSLHHEQLANRRRQNVGPLLLGPHRPPPDFPHVVPRHGTHRPHPPVQRLRLHHVLHHLRHQVF